MSAIDVIELENKYEILGILDNEKEKGTRILNYEVIGNDNDIENISFNDVYFIITVGQIKTSSIREKIAKKISSKKIATVISPNSYVSKYATIKQGSIIMHNVVINAGANIGEHCIINTMANIEHGVTIKDLCHISTGAMINGDVVINEKTFIGSNATIAQSIIIKPNSVISAGEFIKR